MKTIDDSHLEGDELLDGPPDRFVGRAYFDKDASEEGSRALTFVASTSGTKRDGLDLEIDGLQTDNFEKNPVFLWAHDYGGRTLPIGKVTKLRKLKNRLDATVEFDDSDEFAKTVEQKYRDGFLSAVSIGWRIFEWERGLDTDDFDYRVTSSDLLDISAVPIPGDPTALIKAQRDFLAGDGYPDLSETEDDGTETASERSVEPAGEEETTTVAELTKEIDEISVRLDEAIARLDESPTGDEPDLGTLADLRALRDALPTT